MYFILIKNGSSCRIVEAPSLKTMTILSMYCGKVKDNWQIKGKYVKNAKNAKLIYLFSSQY
jgi:hypothetical protein